MKRMRQLARSPFQFLVVGILAAGLSGCGSGSAVQVVDLNKVLDVMVATLTAEEGVGTGAKASAVQIASFNERYQQSLNALPLLEAKTVGVSMDKAGTFLGFQDDDANGQASVDELQLFTVEVDEIDENTIRLVATDLQGGYRRDSSPMARMGTGLLMGALIGSMLSRRSTAGISRSKFRGQAMSPKNYHSKAVSSAKAKARSRSGSRSLKFGK